ncbi:MAG: response regulator transcription factor [Fimbriimonas sp.]
MTIQEPQYKVVVVEDERAMSDLLEQALRESGFEVAVAANGEEGLALAPDCAVMIVDVMMPVMDGFEMVRQLRQGGNPVPVLFLTAKDGALDLVEGLDLGGDDYLVKPFRLVELLARLRALIRRSMAGQDVLQFGDLWLDRRSRQVRRGERWIYLSTTEFSLLEFFMLHPKTVLTKALILKEIWHEDSYRDDNIVEVYMNYLRSKLEMLNQSRLIHTLRGKGYVLEIREN